MIDAMAKTAGRTASIGHHARDRARRAGIAARRRQAAMKRICIRHRADPHPDSPPRRRAACMRAAAGRLPASATRTARAAATTLPPTPAQRRDSGPFYPPQEACRQRRRPDRRWRAAPAARRERSCTSSGRVLDITRHADRRRRARAVAGQCLRPLSSIPRDSDRAGRSIPISRATARCAPDADGQFRIKTIKPPPYSGRTPHIHFIVAGGSTRLTTQMFFEGEAVNERDGLYRYLSARRPARVHRPLRRSRARGRKTDSVAVVWDIVLAA